MPFKIHVTLCPNPNRGTSKSFADADYRETSSYFAVKDNDRSDNTEFIFPWGTVDGVVITEHAPVV
jgi:hypothetical protein